MKTLHDANLDRIKLSDFVTLSKKYPSVFFLPLFSIMDKIFITVDLLEVPTEDKRTPSEKRRASRSQSGSASHSGSASRRQSANGSQNGSNSASRRQSANGKRL